MSVIYVKYIEINLSKSCWSSRGKIDKAQKLEKLLLKEKNSKVTLTHPIRGETSFFVLTIEDQGRFFFTAHRKKYKWMISWLKNVDFWTDTLKSNLQKQLKEKLKRGYSVKISDKTSVVIPIEKQPYFLTERTSPLTIRTIEITQTEEPEKIEQLSMIDMMLM